MTPQNRNKKSPKPLKFKLTIPSKYQFSIKMIYNPLEMPNIKHEHKNNTISYYCSYIFNSTKQIQCKCIGQQADLTNQSTMLMQSQLQSIVKIDMYD